MTSDRPQKTACVIYTRKSSEEGLEQSFNSLDAQYDACAAYIASQRHEGWRLLPRRYDDGGISGATLERPALQQLLADIDAGLVRMVVVYKIDRLTRSLADFARLVERMDAAGCSFVSVTQSFNTSTSMGRLTLNVLLSFAQFEREVTAERIRDKIGASKAKGLWMGGYPPIGYDKHPDALVRSLIINPKEAASVRKIFEVYEATKNLTVATTEIRKFGILSKIHHLKDGSVRGGCEIGRGQLHAILSNPVYAGKIRHKHTIYDAVHEPIIDPERWERVQSLLIANARKPRNNAAQPSSDNHLKRQSAPLRSLLFDEEGQSLTSTYTTKNSKRHRYYVTKPARDRSDQSAWRLPAKAVEETVDQVVAEHFKAHIDGHRLLTSPDISMLPACEERLSSFLESSPNDAEALASIIDRIDLRPGQMVIKLKCEALAQAIGVMPADLSPSLLQVTGDFTCRRRGVETRLVSNSPQTPKPDHTLIRNLHLAHHWFAQLKRGKSLTEIAKAENYSEAFVRTRISIALLSPRIQQAILEGTQPPELTTEAVVRSSLPHRWTAQEAAFGFDPKQVSLD